MIAGIGTDIIEIERIEKAMKNPRFLEKHFTKAENDFFVGKNYKPETAAASFAAKEAFSKALGTGVSGFSLSDIEVLRDENGAPYIQLYNNAKAMAEGTKVFVSLSHSKKYATAVVVIER